MDALVPAFAREDVDGQTLLELTNNDLKELGLSLGERESEREESRESERVERVRE
jgi:SAM domain (Sterile alpha motif)